MTNTWQPLPGTIQKKKRVLKASLKIKQSHLQIITNNKRNSQQLQTSNWVLNLKRKQGRRKERNQEIAAAVTVSDWSGEVAWRCGKEKEKRQSDLRRARRRERETDSKADQTRTDSKADPTDWDLSSPKELIKKVCLSPGSNRGPFACEANVITNYTTQTLLTSLNN